MVLLQRHYVDDYSSAGRLEQDLEAKAALRRFRPHHHALVRLVKALREAIKGDSGLRRTTKVLCSTLGVGLATAALLRAFRTGARMNPPQF